MRNKLAAGQGADADSSAAHVALSPPSPPPDGAGAAASLPSPEKARSRWMERATGALLLSAAAVSLVPAAPAILRALDAGDPRAEVAPAGKVARFLPAPASPLRPSAAADDDTEDERSPHVLPDPGPDGNPSAGDAQIRIGLASRALKLFDEPTPHGDLVGEIAAGELVMVMRESGDWVLIAQVRDQGVLRGWGRRSEIAVR